LHRTPVCGRALSSSVFFISLYFDMRVHGMCVGATILFTGFISVCVFKKNLSKMQWGGTYTLRVCAFFLFVCLFVCFVLFLFFHDRSTGTGELVWRRQERG
jgi:uncharacterized membrane protein